MINQFAIDVCLLNSYVFLLHKKGITANNSDTF